MTRSPGPLDPGKRTATREGAALEELVKLLARQAAREALAIAQEIAKEPDHGAQPPLPD